ncbi:hypothetical protein CEXT_264961 [Caerostris extrusa]|uniref:Uncharacterized protein n=1 Tax=Caerostris extrusa TaxID=172846 RepID=A0AAV4WWD0_CAEEX|nr:hypothetical protein CEXT_264961 [Caerostris extrusa]
MEDLRSVQTPQFAERFVTDSNRFWDASCSMWRLPASVFSRKNNSLQELGSEDSCVLSSDFLGHPRLLLSASDLTSGPGRTLRQTH